MKIQPDSQKQLAEVSPQVQRSMDKLAKKMEKADSRINEGEIERTKEILKRKLSLAVGRVNVENRRSIKVLTDENVVLESKKISDFAKDLAKQLNLDGKGSLS